MNRMKKDKVRVGVLMAVSLAVIVSAVLMAAFSGGLDSIQLALVTFLVVGIAAMFLAFGARALIKDINKGIPFQDERSKRVVEKSGANSFIVMLYLLLAIGWYSDSYDTDLMPADVTGMAILGGAVSFAVFWVFFNRRASIE